MSDLGDVEYLHPERVAAPAGGRYLLGVVLCLGSAVCFGLLGPLLRQVGTLPATEIGSIRFGVAALTLGVMVVAGRRRWPTGRALIGALVLGAVLYTAQSLAYVGAVRRISVGLSSLLLYLFPVMVVGGSILRGRERLTVWTPVATVLAVGGVGLAALGGGAGPANLLGVLFGLTAATVYTFYFFGVDALGPGVDRLAAAAVICAGSAVANAALSVADGFVVPTAAQWGWLALLGVVAAAVPITTLMLGMNECGAATAAVVSCAEPVTAVLLGAALFGERLGWAGALGTIGVVAAVVVLQLQERTVRRAVTGGSHTDSLLTGGSAASGRQEPGPVR